MISSEGNIAKMTKTWIVILFLSYGATIDMKIGVIMYKNSPDLEAILDYAGSNITTNNSVTLVPVKKEINHGDLVAAEEYVCELAKEGVYGIIDTTTGRTSAHVQSVCDSVEMPHVVTQQNILQARNWSVVNLYPSAETYNRILVDLIQAKEWQNFTIMYMRGNSIASVSALLELNSQLDLFTITVRELSGDNYRPVFAAAKKHFTENFLIDCPANKLERVLRHAQEVGLMSNSHSYIFTSPDLHTLDLSPFKYGGANITGFRLIDPENDFAQSVIQAMVGYGYGLSTHMTLLHDAALILAKAYEKLPVTPMSIECESQTWHEGSSVINILRTNVLEGLTRELVFSSDGRRNNFTFDIFELTSSGQVKVAVWKENLKITREFIKLSVEEKGIMKNKTFTVLIALTPPYAFIKDTIDEMSGNERYEGFAIDIIEEVSQFLGFSYEFQIEESAGTYKDGKATGMVKKLVDNEADFAISDITITQERQAAIDFTTPFMSVGISILYKKPSKQPPAMFSFMEPFDREVWVYMMLAMFLLAFLTIFIGRTSYKEWHNPFPCVEKPESLENQFSLANAMWFIIGSVMQQGSEIAPIALGTRTIASAWWFFTMVMIAYYTGTLVAFLTVESKTLPFKTAEDLASQTYISYGAKKGGATLQFFNQSNNEIYRKMFKVMSKREFESCPADPDGNTKGRERVQAGRYAFFMESAAIEYELERNCDLMKVGDQLDTKNYGIGMQKNSTYRAAMNEVILKMKEAGTLARLKNKWWKERRGGGACTDADSDGQTTQLEMKNMVGAFVVLGVGSCIGILIAILDMLWGIYKKTLKYETSFKTELIEELRFALKFSGDTKPVKKRPKREEPTEETEEKQEEQLSISSEPSVMSGQSRRTRHSHCSSSRSQSVAFARRRRYS